MKNSFSYKYALTAVVMALVLVFSVPLNIACMHISPLPSENFASEQKQNDVISVEAQSAASQEDIPSDGSSADNTPSDTQQSSQPNVQEPSSVSPGQEMPGEDTALKPDEMLPESNGTQETEPETPDTEISETEIYIPAKVSNAMRDSLPSVIAKKIYTFSTQERGAVIYAFNHMNLTEKGCLWYISFYEEYSPDGTGSTTDYRLLNRLEYTSIGVSCQSSIIGIMPGNYRIVVECVSGYTQDKYDLLIGFSETDSYETECNDTESRYNELPLNKTMNGSASMYPDGRTDVDCYLFNVTETGYVVLYFNHETDSENIKDNVAWRISLTDMQGNEYFYATSKMSKTMLNSGIMGLSPGYYFVKIYSHMYSNVAYSLNVSFEAEPAIESEMNDSPETADTIAINTEKIGALTLRNDSSDRDFYTFEMEQDGFIVLDFIHEALTEVRDGWKISVIREDGSVAYSAISDWSQAVLQSPNIGLVSGRYYIEISSDNLYHNSLVYRLILLTVQSDSWESEPNNTPETADDIIPGNTVNGTMIESGVDYDKDWFVFELEQDGKVSVDFMHIVTKDADKQGWIITLLDESGNELDSVYSYWDDEGQTFSEELSAGKYYIRVETGLYYNSSRYLLTLNVQ